MKYLGIDYGTKRIGIAISDDAGMIAFPREIIENTKEALEKIITIISQENINAVVIGESVRLDGRHNQIQKSIDSLKQKISDTMEIPVFLEKEWMSSVAADSHLYSKGNIANERWSGSLNDKRRASTDDKAAAVILQRFLDRK